MFDLRSRGYIYPRFYLTHFAGVLVSVFILAAARTLVLYCEEMQLVRILCCMQVGRNDRGWKQWFDKDAPEESQIPDGYHISLDSFRKLLLIR